MDKMEYPFGFLECKNKFVNKYLDKIAKYQCNTWR